jgi:hypothetical protein
MTTLAAASMALGLVSGVLATSDANRVQHAVGGAEHRVSEELHKQVKDYHLRKARHDARKGNLRGAMRHEEKAEKHAVAQQEQHHEARVKEKALRND